MLRKIRTMVRQNRGQSVVEFALILPIFLLLLVGMLEFGRILYWQTIVNEAAREAARVVALTGDRTQAAPAIVNFGTFPAPTVTPSRLVFRQPITVTVTYNVALITPLLSSFFPANQFTVSASASMREENYSPIN
ncbi:TadE/TadG family type IV pilus assembly protein [Paenibacillus sp. GP183]|uniref:TadE/TadG family type IV pilus assembly protein n=1 Tax=Paenibacillus sp. GP183 TaxID=1882751 RepID=UPI000895CFD7|nr:TadE/TadG family type IV pilus assembly protein [Paenibacillus sp. GP183]SEB79890.1 TadE-like protein [Paenibacillus sp. GP183]